MDRTGARSPSEVPLTGSLHDPAQPPQRPRFKKEEFYVLDGGFATHLSRVLDDQGALFSDPLWSCRALKTNPAAVVRTHEAFVNAGADIVTTNTYQASAELFQKHLDFLDPILGPHLLIESAPKLARKAVQGSRRQPIVVGSVGPYGACLGDGSEYSGSYVDSKTRSQLSEWHTNRIKRLRVSGIDLFAVETIPSVIEALAVLDVLDKIPGAKCWISFQCKEGGKKTARGEPLRLVFKQLAEHPAFWYKVEAIGANCVSSDDVENILREFNKSNHWSQWPNVLHYKKVPYVVYPNSGRKYDEVKKEFIHHETDGVAKIVGNLKLWMSLGVNVIGGCCHIFPEDVTKIKERMLLDMFDACEMRSKMEEATRDTRGDWENVLDRLKKPSYEELKRQQEAMSGFAKDLTGDGGVGAFSRLHHETERFIIEEEKTNGNKMSGPSVSVNQANKD